MRLAGRTSLASDRVREMTAVVFGAGDHRTRTEDRPPPPALAAGDALVLGPLRATVLRTLGHPRLAALSFAGPPDAIWAGIARHGRPIQYAHFERPLALRVVDAIVTGVHEPADSHYELLRAFAPDAVLRRMSAALERHGYRSHEFGDSVLVVRRSARRPPSPSRRPATARCRA